MGQNLFKFANQTQWFKKKSSVWWYWQNDRCQNLSLELWRVRVVYAFLVFRRFSKTVDLRWASLVPGAGASTTTEAPGFVPLREPPHYRRLPHARTTLFVHSVGIKPKESTDVTNTRYRSVLTFHDEREQLAVFCVRYNMGLHIHPAH